MASIFARTLGREDIVKKSKIFLRTFGWPYVQVPHDDIGTVDEDKWFEMMELWIKLI